MTTHEPWRARHQVRHAHERHAGCELYQCGFNGSFTFDSNGARATWQWPTGLRQRNKRFANLVTRAWPHLRQLHQRQESSLANVFDMALFAQDDWKFNPGSRSPAAFAGRRRITSRITTTGRRAWHCLCPGWKRQRQEGQDRAARRIRLLLRPVGNRQSEDHQPRECPEPDRAQQSDMHLHGNFAGCHRHEHMLQHRGTSTASTPVKYEVAPHYHSPYTEQAASAWSGN
jgi:hypothetical protein